MPTQKEVFEGVIRRAQIFAPMLRVLQNEISTALAQPDDGTAPKGSVLRDVATGFRDLLAIVLDWKS